MCEPATITALAASAAASASTAAATTAVAGTFAAAGGASLAAGTFAGVGALSAAGSGIAATSAFAGLGASLSTAFTVLSGVTSILTGVVGPMMAHSAQSQQADAQRRQNEEIRKNAYLKAKADNEGLVARQIEEDSAAAQKKFQAHQTTKSNIATKRTQLEGRGVLDTGTGDDLIRNLLFEEGQYTNSVTNNLDILNKQFGREKDAIGLRHRSAVSGLQTPIDPSGFATGLQIAGNVAQDSPKIKRLSKIAERSFN